MIRQKWIGRVFHISRLWIICGLFTSCIQPKQVFKGAFNDQLHYNYSYFNYTNVSSGRGAHQSKSQTKSCRVFQTDIWARKNHILEKIVRYSCSDLTPFKMVLIYNEKGKMTGQQYFLSVTDNNFTMPLSEDEKSLFVEISKRQMPGEYGSYAQINGFRPATPADSIETLPYLKDVAISKLIQ